ncbi:hypothetical protein C8Q74DRAFT_1215119 [Fomes fomentarius]|nr:hypothetical protein C8Q74DRAFT_1215119 [Fomes fomentarius]
MCEVHLDANPNHPEYCAWAQWASTSEGRGKASLEDLSVSHTDIPVYPLKFDVLATRNASTCKFEVPNCDRSWSKTELEPEVMMHCSGKTHPRIEEGRGIIDCRMGWGGRMDYALLRGDVSSTLRFLHCTEDDVHDGEPEPEDIPEARKEIGLPRVADLCGTTEAIKSGTRKSSDVTGFTTLVIRQDHDAKRNFICVGDAQIQLSNSLP